MKPLVDAVGDRRLLEARLTGGFRFGPLSAPPSGQPGSGSPRGEVDAAANALGEQVERSPTAEGRHALAVAHLLMEELDGAITDLERLARDTPGDGGILSDLAAAYLTRAGAVGLASDYPAALDAAARAHRAAPHLPEALYNEALALDALGLAAEAQAAWGAAAGLEEGGWGQEARERGRASAPLRAAGKDGAEWPEQRRRLEEDILYAWAAAAGAGDRGAAGLNEASRLARALRERSGETFHADLAEDLAAASTSRRQVLITGLRALEAAQEAADTDRWAESHRAALEAHAALERARSPAVWLAATRVGAALYYLSRLPEAEETLQRIAAACPRRYLAPRARALWLLGLVRFVRHRPYEALRAHEEAHALYERLRERPHSLFLRALMAQDLFALGREEPGWREWRTVMESLDEVPLAPRRLFTVLWEGARRLLHDRPEASLVLMNRAVNAARPSGDAALLTAALARRARAAVRCGELEQTRLDLAEATRLLPRVSGELRQRWQRDLEMLSAEVRGRQGGDTAGRLRAIASAMAADGNAFETLEVREQAARELAAQGRNGAAIEELEQVVAAGADASLHIDDPIDAALFRRRMNERRLELARLYIQETHPWSAFLAVHGVAPDPARPDPVAAVQRRLAAGDVLVQMIEMPRGIYRWTLTAQSRDAGLVAQGVAQAIAHMLRAELRSATGRVYVYPAGRLAGLQWGRLFALAERADDAALLVLAADGPPSNRPPSDGVFSRVTVLATSKAVGGEAYTLPALPLVDDEVRMLREVYGARLTRVAAGSPALIGQRLDGADLVHVAGHAVVDDVDAARSALIMDDGTAGEIALYAADVAHFRWRRPPRLVVLNVCRGGDEAANAFSLAHAFIAAGAETVVAATEPVADEDSYRFASVFHSSLRRGEPPLRALRTARQSCTRSALSSCRGFVALARVDFFTASLPRRH